jgi:hypothetical protein
MIVAYRKGLLMAKDDSRVPHFLTVARSLARCRGVAFPLAASAAIGIGCGGTTVISSGGTGGYGGAELGRATMAAGTGGYDGCSMGLCDGGPTGVAVMPEAGVDAGH